MTAENNTKNKKMLPLVVVLITAATLAFWFLRQRKRLQGEEKRSALLPVRSDAIGDTGHFPVLKTEPSSEPEYPVEERTQPASPIYANALSHQEPPVLFHQSAEQHLHHASNNALLVAFAPAASDDGMVRADVGEDLAQSSSLAVPELKDLTNGLGDGDSSAPPLVPMTTAPAVTGNDPQAECAEAAAREIEPETGYRPNDELPGAEAEPDGSTPEDADTRLRNEGDAASFLATATAGSDERLPPTNPDGLLSPPPSQTSPGPIDRAGTSDLSGHDSFGLTSVCEGGVHDSPGSALPAECAAPSPENIQTAAQPPNDELHPSGAEPDALAHQGAEPLFRNDDTGMLLLPSVPTGSDWPLPPANADQTAPPFSGQTSEHTELTNGAGASGIGDHASSDPPIMSAAAATDLFDTNLENEYAALAPETVRTADQPPGDELRQTNAGTGQTSQRSDEVVGEDFGESPLRYRPPVPKPPRQTAAQPVTPKVDRSPSAESTLGIRVRLTFDRFGFCVIGLLPERKPESDDELAVKYGGSFLRLVAQEDWYQDLQFENIGDLLRRGLELKGPLTNQRRPRWLLTGRDVYVLASHPRASGFVSTSRLALGRSHVVLCVAELLQQAEAVLNEAGCQGYAKLDESHGVPAGWVGLRGVAPAAAIALELGSDPFYALKPAPDIEIELEGGVCLRNSVWLAGYPPQIKILGNAAGTVRVLIDGKEAHPTEDGSLVADGYDLSGATFRLLRGLVLFPVLFD